MSDIFHTLAYASTNVRYAIDAGTPELGGGGQEGQLPLLPFARRGKGGRSAL